MKYFYTLIALCFTIIMMDGCSKEKEQQPATTNTTYNSGGGNNTNSGNNTGNVKPAKPITNTLPAGHPVGSAAACGGCHKGFMAVPEWVKDDIIRQEEAMKRNEQLAAKQKGK